MSSSRPWDSGGVELGGVRARPGEKATGWLGLGRGTDGFPLGLAVGVREGPGLCVTAGLHGTEYAGVEAALRFLGGLDPRDMAGWVAVAPVVDVAAARARSMYVSPVDGLNLNRCFPGDPQGNRTRRLARALFAEVAAPADYLVDLHGGELVEELWPFVAYHFTGNPAVDEGSSLLADAFGIPVVAVTGEVQGEGSFDDAGTLYAAAAQAGVSAIIAEAGGGGRVDEESVRVHLRGLWGVVEALGLIQRAGEREAAGAGARAAQPVAARARLVPVMSPVEGRFRPLVAPGSRVEAGQALGRVEEFFGRELAVVTSPARGLVLLVVTAPFVAAGAGVAEVAEVAERGGA